jgi:esterase/lipase superfamily enzyme
MHLEYHRWYSPALNRHMDLLIFGRAGAKCLVFPTSMGKFYEWEDRGMMGALADLLNNGWLQMYCVDSVDAESWYARWAHPAGRVYRHMQYENYLLDEVLPLMRHKNRHPFLITTGASFGAYHAANFAFRHPEIVDRVIAMSGLYDLRRWMDGYFNDNFYFNNPVDYLPNEHQ